MKYLKLFEDHQNANAYYRDDYGLLGRLQSDCEYFLGYGNGLENRLWADNIEEQILKMKELWEKLPVKPVWLSYEQIEEYERKMLDLRNNPKKYYDDPNSILLQ